MVRMPLIYTLGQSPSKRGRLRGWELVIASTGGSGEPGDTVTE
jgi:hypothetical protein